MRFISFGQIFSVFTFAIENALKMKRFVTVQMIAVMVATNLTAQLLSRLELNFKYKTISHKLFIITRFCMCTMCD